MPKPSKIDTYRQGQRVTLRFASMLALLVTLNGCGGEEGHKSQTFTPSEISLREAGDLKELLDDKLVFIDSRGTEWTAPSGTLTDGASIPRIALPITDGRWDKTFLKAAVVHDAYCQVENATRTPGQYRTRPWQDVHRMFYDAMIAGDTAPVLAKIMFAAVWLAGPRWDDPASNNIENISSEMLTRAFVGSKDWIEESNPTVEQIVLDLKQREPVLLQLNRLETNARAAIEAGDTRMAQRLLRNEENLINENLGRRPDDLMLLSFKGHLHQNEAILQRRMNNDAEANRALIQSETSLNKVIAKEPQDPSSLSGLSKVYVLRGQLDRGEELSREALRIAPEFEPARRDLERIDELRELEP